MIKQNVNTIRIGHVIEHKNRMWSVVKTTHVKPGKGGAFVQMELKDVVSGTKTLDRFRSEETLKRAHVEERPFQFLYQEGDNLHLMDDSTYEQISLPVVLLGEQAKPFLTENLTLRVDFIDDKPVAIRMPTTIVAEIAQADAVVKGQTASASYKPAVLDNGVRIMVPSYIGGGEKIVLEIAELRFVERYKAKN